MEITPLARIEAFFWKLIILGILFTSCAGGCASCAIKKVWDAGTPLPLPCGSVNIHNERGNCD
jgi:hypothetical protein